MLALRGRAYQGTRQPHLHRHQYPPLVPSRWGAFWVNGFSWSSPRGCVNIYPMQNPFIEPTPTRESCWRAIVMMGRNLATYKFALAASLIELSSKGSDFIPLEDLAAPFSKNLCEHLRHSDKQITSRRSQFLDNCRKANHREVSSQELFETTARLRFVNVI